MKTGRAITNVWMIAVVMVILGLTAGNSHAQVIKPTSAVSIPAPRVQNPESDMLKDANLSGGGTSGDILSETHSNPAGGNYWRWESAVQATGVGIVTFTLPTDSTVGELQHGVLGPGGGNASSPLSSVFMPRSQHSDQSGEMR